MMKPAKIRDASGDTLECHVGQGYLCVYVGHDNGRGCEIRYLGAKFTSDQVPALRKWAKALLKMCDDKSLEVGE